MRLEQIKIPAILEFAKYRLVRKKDKLTKLSVDVGWVEFDENNQFREKYNEIKIGRSLLMSPFNKYFTWQTTEVTEIIESKDDYIKFKTKNSIYELFKIDENEQRKNN